MRLSWRVLSTKPDRGIDGSLGFTPIPTARRPDMETVFASLQPLVFICVLSLALAAVGLMLKYFPAESGRTVAPAKPMPKSPVADPAPFLYLIGAFSLIPVALISIVISPLILLFYACFLLLMIFTD
jgi:hypothetical protein